MHRHVQLSTNSLMCRMTVHNARTLFYPSRFDKEEARLRDLIKDLERQMRNQVYSGPRQAYCQMLIAHCKRGRVHGDPSHHAMRRAVVKLHAKEFRKLTPLQVAACSVRASANRQVKVDELAETRHHVVAQVSLLHTRRQEAELLGVPNHVDSCRYGETEFARFAELWEHYEGAKDTLGTLKAPPGQIHSAALTLLNEQISQMDAAKREVPSWVAAVIGNREDFVGVGFYSDSRHPNVSVVYKLVLAIAQPRRLIFLECHRCIRRLPDMLSLPRGVMPVVLAYGDYSYAGMRFVDHWNVPLDNADDIMVCPETCFMRSSVHSYSNAVPFSVFRRSHRPPTSASRMQPSTLARSRGPIDEEVLRLLQLEFPWLTLEEIRNMLRTRVDVGGGGGGGGGGGASGSAHEEPVELPQDVLAAVSTQLDAMREEVAGIMPAESYFVVKVLGGEWSIKLKRKAASDVSSYPKNKFVQDWCAAVAWPPSKSYAVTKYGHGNAVKLASEVCRRGDYFVREFVARDCPNGFDFAAIASGYASTPEYVEWFDNLPLNSFSSQAAFQIRQLVLRPTTQ